MQQKDAYYFPHFCNARHDRKVRRIRKELGIEGYGIFFMLLEILREQTDYKYPMIDIDLLADEMGTSEQKIRTVICNYGLFQLDEKENFFSSKMIMYLQPYIETKELNQANGFKGNLIKYGYSTKEELEGLNKNDILLLRKEIESLSGGESGGDHQAIANKIKEIKINKNKTNKKITFKKPSLDDIKKYCIDRKNNIDPEKFYDYYDSNNWVDGKGCKVKSWKQRVISWEGRDNSKNKKTETDRGYY